MVTIKNIRQTGEGFPSQWEGELQDDRPFYIRYRHGHLYVSVGKKGQIIPRDLCQYETIFEWERPDGMNGIMSLEELKEITKEVLIFPE